MSKTLNNILVDTAKLIDVPKEEAVKFGKAFGAWTPGMNFKRKGTGDGKAPAKGDKDTPKASPKKFKVKAVTTKDSKDTGDSLRGRINNKEHSTLKDARNSAKAKFGDKKKSFDDHSPAEHKKYADHHRAEYSKSKDAATKKAHLDLAKAHDAAIKKSAPPAAKNKSFSFSNEKKGDTSAAPSVRLKDTVDRKAVAKEVSALRTKEHGYNPGDDPNIRRLKSADGYRKMADDHKKDASHQFKSADNIAKIKVSASYTQEKKDKEIAQSLVRAHAHLQLAKERQDQIKQHKETDHVGINKKLSHGEARTVLQKASSAGPHKVASDEVKAKLGINKPNDKLDQNDHKKLADYHIAQYTTQMTKIVNKKPDRNLKRSGEAAAIDKVTVHRNLADAHRALSGKEDASTVVKSARERFAKKASH